jgi:hypothetical protein
MKRNRTDLDDSIRILTIQLVNREEVLVGPPQVLLAGHDEMCGTALARLEVGHGGSGVDLELVRQGERVEEEAQRRSEAEGMQAPTNGIARDGASQSTILTFHHPCSCCPSCTLTTRFGGVNEPLRKPWNAIQPLEHSAAVLIQRRGG